MYTINLLARANSSDQSSAMAENGRLFNVDRNPFICSRCSKAFPTTHALGGHQNAHRRERNEERWKSMEERRKKAREIPIPCPRPPGDGQIIDFWAKQLAKPEDQSSHGPMPYGAAGFFENQKFMGNWEMHGYEERDFLGTAAGHGGDSWLEEIPVAISGDFDGGDYGSRELTSTRELDLTLRL